MPGTYAAPPGRPMQPGIAASTVISVTPTDAPADAMHDAQLEALRVAIPAARSLPLLSKLARQEPGRVVIDYLESQRIAIEVSPWR